MTERPINEEEVLFFGAMIVGIALGILLLSRPHGASGSGSGYQPQDSGQRALAKRVKALADVRADLLWFGELTAAQQGEAKERSVHCQDGSQQPEQKSLATEVHLRNRVFGSIAILTHRRNDCVVSRLV